MTWRPIRKLPPRLGGFMPRVSADVAQLARNMREQLLQREDVQKLRGMYDGQPRPDLAAQREGPAKVMDDYERLKIVLTDTPNEGFKLMPWIVREYKRGRINRMNRRHAQDIIDQAVRWMVWAKEHNQSLPDMMNKQFGFDQLEQWVYEMNARNVDESGGWTDSKVVYKFDDGWHIDEVGPEDLAREGELMGHCVGGYCQTVTSGESTIFSLRDPKGEPHVTIEMGGERGHDVTRGYGEIDHHDRDLIIIQEQGKSNHKPIPEYEERIERWYDHLRDQGWHVTYQEDIEPEVADNWDDTTVYPANHEGIEDFYNALSDRWDRHEFERDEDPEVEYDRGRQIYNERVPNYIGHPTNTYHDAETGDHPVRANMDDIKRTMAQTLQILWNGRGYEPGQWYAQAYYAAAHHALESSGGANTKQEMDDLVSFASNWVAQKVHSLPPTAPKQPTLFEPNDYFTQRAVPPGVKEFLHYLVGYEEAASSEVKDDGMGNTWSVRYPNYPTMPNEGSWPIARFPEYFGGLEQNFPQHFTPTEQMAGTFAKKAYMIERLRKMAGYTTDWSFDPSASEFQPLHCPFDGHELEVRLHGGAECLGCGHEFELGHDGTILPSDNTVEERSHEWPDSLPWGEAEQDFYRHAMVWPT